MKKKKPSMEAFKAAQKIPNLSLLETFEAAIKSQESWDLDKIANQIGVDLDVYIPKTR